MLFSETVDGWSSWGKVFRSIPAFTPLVEEIFRREGLPFLPLENLTPGTNAVFKVGGYVVKVFSPKESGLDGARDMRSEVFATDFAHSLGVSAPRIVATGMVRDRYDFSYLIMDYLGGVEVERARPAMTRELKLRLGAEARRLIDLMNVPCDNFNGVDVIHDEDRQQRWDVFPETFKRERREYIGAHLGGVYSPDRFVFVHGDLTGDNMLVDGDKLVILDFADAVVAPRCYELAALVFGMIDCDRDMLDGFGADPHTLADELFDGLLIHDFGGDIVAHEIAPPDSLHTLDDLRRAIAVKLGGAL